MDEPWSDPVEEVLAGDHVTMLAYVTPAKGVVLLPVSNFAEHDRAAGTVTVNSSVALWKKLVRMKRNPHVALAFHSRAHSRTDRPEYVLIQGRVSLGAPVDDYPSTILDKWERFEPWRDQGRLWKRFRRVYGVRVPIVIHAERVTTWPDLACRGTVTVEGAARPESGPPSQRPPRKGTAPRIRHRRSARGAAKLPHVLLGWVGADGFPEVAPVRITDSDQRGMLLAAPPGLVPPGARRAGLTAHWFARGMIGQNQRKYTGWLEARDEELVYAPHTESSYRLPESLTLYRLVSGAATRVWLWRARRSGALAQLNTE
jgi:hypothetical protein